MGSAAPTASTGKAMNLDKQERCGLFMLALACVLCSAAVPIIEILVN